MKKGTAYQTPYIRVVNLGLSSDVAEGIVITSYEGEFDVKEEMEFDDETDSGSESSSNLSNPSVWEMAWD
ncbi:MAG: hypothetical protein IJ762_11220 [Bacteroidaceae bacterium]|nr:hypothetical protein [Bacteroidaceae bacterium]